MGSASAVFPFPVNSSLPRGIEDASSGCCKSFLRSWSGAESLHKMAWRPAQYLHVAHCLLFMSFVFLRQSSAFPVWWKASSIRFWVFFLNVQRSICLPFDFWQLDICAVLFYPQAEKNLGSLSSSRALASTCADNLDKEGTLPRHSDILKLTNV